MTEGTKIPFRGYADEKPGVEPGDVVIVIMEKEHHLFQRKGNELIVKLNISLSEALTGFWNGFYFTGFPVRPFSGFRSGQLGQSKLSQKNKIR